MTTAADRTETMTPTTHLALPAPQVSHADLFFKLALAAGIVVAGLEIGYLLYSPLPYDPIGYVVGRDFANTWLGDGSH